MLTEVLIQNFRSCKNTHLRDLKGVVGLLGPNGVGKTNILRAMSWASRLATSLAVESRPAEPRTVEFGLTLGKESLSYSIGFQELASRPKNGRTTFLKESLYLSKGSAKSLLFRRRNDKVHFSGVSDPLTIPSDLISVLSLQTTFHAIRKNRRYLGGLRKFLLTLRYYDLDEPNELGPDAVLPHGDYTAWVSDPGNLGALDRDVKIKIIHLALTDKEGFEELKILMGKECLGLISDIKLEIIENQRTADMRFARLYKLSFVPFFINSSIGFSYSELSLGTRRVLRILASLLLDKSSVMLLEHPEDGIHSSLLEKLLGILRSYSERTQIILTTHSPFVMNCLEPEEVRLVTMEEGETQVRALTSRDLQFFAAYKKTEGALSDFLEIVQSR